MIFIRRILNEPSRIWCHITKKIKKILQEWLSQCPIQVYCLKKFIDIKMKLFFFFNGYHIYSCLLWDFKIRFLKQKSSGQKKHDSSFCWNPCTIGRVRSKQKIFSCNKKKKLKKMYFNSIFSSLTWRNTFMQICTILQKNCNVINKWHKILSILHLMLNSSGMSTLSLSNVKVFFVKVSWNVYYIATEYSVLFA